MKEQKSGGAAQAATGAQSTELVPQMQQTIAELQKQVLALKEGRQDIAVLGDGQVFIRRTEDGAIKSVVGAITLSEKAGQIVDIQGKSMITAVGYNEMNKIAGVSIITPKTLVLPSGQVVVNPYPILDERGGIDKVWVKKLAIGYSPTGNLTITSSTLLYDIKGYFLADIIKKMKYDKAVGKIIPIEMKKEYLDSLKFEEKLVTKAYDFDNEVCIVVDFRNKDVNSCFETYSESKKFAERKAQTVAERNAMKKHPALAQVYANAAGPEKNKSAKVRVVGWVHDLSSEDLQRLADQAEQGEKAIINGMEVIVQDANVIDPMTEEDFVSSRDEEEIKPEDNEDKDVPEMQEVPIGKEDKATEESTRIAELLKKIQQGIAIIGDEKAKTLIEKKFKTPLDKIVNVGQLEMVLKVIGIEVDKDQPL